MPIRNPFARRPGPAVQDENQRPGSAAGTPEAAHPGFERVDTVGSKASSAFSVRSRRSEDTGEYKLSVVNDSGVYLPPSPIEKEAPWPRRYLSRTSTTSDRSSVISGSGLGTGGGGGGTGEIEHFSISRESFDSYRRSFDISAKSPVFMATDALAPGRQSLDSHLFSPPTPRFPRSSLGDHPRSPPMMQRRWDRQREQSLRSEEGKEEQVDEEECVFEEVGLHNDGAADSRQSQPPPPPRRRGFFAKFASDSSAGTPEASASSPPAAAATPAEETGMMSRFLPLSGRKRAPSSSVQGAELRAMPVAGLDGPERVETPVAGLQAGEA